MSIKISQVLFNNNIVDVAIEGDRIKQIASRIDGAFDSIIDGHNKLLVPPFYNTHCHAAMTLLRGIADNLELMEWLEKHIWPAENNLTAEAVYIGSKLAMLEMIKSGTVFFNDMYFFPEETVRAAEEMGIRAAVGMIAIDTTLPEKRAKYISDNNALWEKRQSFSDLITLTLAPHAIYTVHENTLREISERSAAENLPIHIHLSETAFEVEQRHALHNSSPVEYLDKLGLLSERTIAAHSVHLSDKDIEILADRKVTVSYNPCSNYKLSSGRFRFRSLMDAGVNITFGTDGCASSDNLSMFDEMKFGALGAKNERNSSTACSVNEIYDCATCNGAKAFNINAGVIAENRKADMVLIDLDTTMMIADHNPVSNLVYAADSSCVDTVICNGRVLMQNRKVPGEKEIMAQAREFSRNLLKK
ncbi:MAG: amidohydrolase [Lentisphaeria bacterium]|nr:amidohydrolase [Lentisphaeria bacterium]